MSIIIKNCTLSDAQAYTKHCIEHMKEKGNDGLYAHPFPSSHLWDEKEQLEKIVAKWSLPAFSANWETAWVAMNEDKIVGHLNLRTGGIDALKHRMRLGMGILKTHRSLGIGNKLLTEALKWATQQKEISWIDLSVFENNSSALHLYKKYGFQTIYTIEDALRIEDKSYNDIQMTLKISH